MSQFKYDGIVLDPETAEVKILGETVTFTELPKKYFDEMITELFTTDLMKDVEHPDPNDPEKKVIVKEQREFQDLSGELTGKAIKFIALSADKPEKFFKDAFAKMPNRAFVGILGLVYQLNHVAEFMSAAGNVAMLPLVTELGMSKSSDEKSQQTT
jgi:hypothetical protein